MESAGPSDALGAEGEGAKGDSFYVLVDGVILERTLLQRASEAAATGNGTIAYEAAKEIWRNTGIDGTIATDVDLRTLEHIIKEYKFDDMAKIFLKEALLEGRRHARAEARMAKSPSVKSPGKSPKSRGSSGGKARNAEAGSPYEAMEPLLEQLAEAKTASQVDRLQKRLSKIQGAIAADEAAAAAAADKVAEEAAVMKRPSGPDAELDKADSAPGLAVKKKPAKSDVASDDAEVAPVLAVKKRPAGLAAEPTPALAAAKATESSRRVAKRIPPATAEEPPPPAAKRLRATSKTAELAPAATEVTKPAAVAKSKMRKSELAVAKGKAKSAVAKPASEVAKAKAKAKVLKPAPAKVKAKAETKKAKRAIAKANSNAEAKASKVKMLARAAKASPGVKKRPAAR